MNDHTEAHGRVRAFLAISIDGYIAGPDDDLSWLPMGDLPGPGALDLEQFMAGIGAILMGRRTWDIVAGFDSWAYGDTPVIVATNRPFTSDRDTVRCAGGPIEELIDLALTVAEGRDVYVDGGVMVQKTLEIDRLDELIATVVPVVLGGGVPLFAPSAAAKHFSFAAPAPYGSMVQLRASRTRDAG